MRRLYTLATALLVGAFLLVAGTGCDERSPRIIAPTPEQAIRPSGLKLGLSGAPSPPPPTKKADTAPKSGDSTSSADKKTNTPPADKDAGKTTDKPAAPPAEKAPAKPPEKP